jgi:2-polyprenyl-3-methyl-5-hydroxy-6-metoxy-1,4-benzoquinol methylase
MQTNNQTPSEAPPANTAHLDWDLRWQSAEGRADWIEAEAFVAEAVPLLRQRGVQTVLDLGCGVGRHALLLAREGFTVHAVDASPAAMEFVAGQAKTAGLDLSLKMSEMTAIPYDNETFDYLLAWNVIYHGDLPVVLRSLAEILRVLKPGGIFQGTMLSKRNTEIATGRRIAKDTYIDTDRFEKRHPHYYCSAAELIALLGGFEVLALIDREHRLEGSFHWHFLAEKL